MSLEKKIELIKASAAVPKPSQKDLGEKFEIGRSTVSDILKKKDHYLKAWESNTSSANKEGHTDGVIERSFVFVLLYSQAKKSTLQRAKFYRVRQLLLQEISGSRDFMQAMVG
jgi:predicted DNA-binding protein YlxM (UPF0122 family)